MKYFIFLALILSSCESITHKYYINITNFSSEPTFITANRTVSIGDLNIEINLDVDEKKLIYLGEQKIGSYSLGNDKTEEVYTYVIFDLEKTKKKTLCQEDLDRHTTNYYIYDEGEECQKGEKVYY